MGSPDGNQDTNETPDLTNNTAAVEINKDAQKVKKYADIIVHQCNVNKFQRKKLTNGELACSDYQ